MEKHTENDLGSADLMLYMGFKCAACICGGGRVSAIGIVCKDLGWNFKKQSINFWGNSYARLGECMAHEIQTRLPIIAMEKVSCLIITILELGQAAVKPILKPTTLHKRIIGVCQNF